MKVYKIVIITDYNKEKTEKLKQKGFKLWKKGVIVANREAELWRKVK